jgi:hypothetical protein
MKFSKGRREMNEIRSVWIVRGYHSRDDGDTPELVYEHAFPTRDEAIAIQRRGERELPVLYWTLDRMNHGHIEFASYMFDRLVKDFADEKVWDE